MQRKTESTTCTVISHRGSQPTPNTQTDRQTQRRHKNMTTSQTDIMDDKKKCKGRNGPVGLFHVQEEAKYFA